MLVSCLPCSDVVICPTCATLSTQLHDTNHRRVRDLDWVGKRTTLLIPTRRFQCQRCRHPFTERLEAIAPRACVLMQIAGLSYLTNSFAMILSPSIAHQLFPIILVPAFVGEASFCLWLLVKGVNVEKWKAKAYAQPTRSATV